jgi:general secretion pathway protein B
VREPSAAVTAAPKAVAPASAAATDAKLPTLAELPPELRSQVPALVVGGSVYSPKASSRIVILNGQVFREGDQPIAGLSVEQIRLKSTVLAFRGQRFELKH